MILHVLTGQKEKWLDQLKFQTLKVIYFHKLYFKALRIYVIAFLYTNVIIF